MGEQPVPVVAHQLDQGVVGDDPAARGRWCVADVDQHLGQGLSGQLLPAQRRRDHQEPLRRPRPGGGLSAVVVVVGGAGPDQRIAELIGGQRARV